MRVREPSRADIVEVGERAGAQLLLRHVVARDRQLLIAGDRRVHRRHPFGLVEPAVTELNQPPDGLRDRDTARVFGVVGGGNVWISDSGNATGKRREIGSGNYLAIEAPAVWIELSAELNQACNAAGPYHGIK